MMVPLMVHGLAAFLLGLLFKASIIFPLVAFIAVEAILLAIAGVEGVFAFIVWALCITQASYVLGIAARAVFNHMAERRKDSIRGSAAHDHFE